MVSTTTGRSDPPRAGIGRDVGRASPRARRHSDGKPTADGAWLDDPGFRDALLEMQALGLRVTAAPHPGSVPHAVLRPRRSDPKRWLVPLHPHTVRVNSLALIQPVRFAARALKHVVVRTGGFGLRALGSSGRVHVSGMPRAAEAVGLRASHGAFFTGTPGPHRKMVAQWMDGRGNILGYAKVSRSAAASALLWHEAFVIGQLQLLGIQSAWLPEVLFHGAVGDATVLVTSTVKTLHSPCPTRLRAMHVAFLSELTARTASTWAMPWEALRVEWNEQVHRLADALPSAWHKRFADAFALLAEAPVLVEPKGLAHGDFTPINTFQERGRLCVFDWEYAGGHYPADFDLVRFLGCLPALRKLRPARRGGAIARILVDEFGRTPTEALRRAIAFLCAYALRGAVRQPRVPGSEVRWEDCDSQAQMLDALLTQRPGS
ncbi:MAG: hypothetical protein OJF55_002190 [Rhodanobacteraceae bacterium]|jgi:hypothetical protein|nr:MAG: hypothetical protein OJF55_002190 [Rhodanobacteraceae bacterium]